MSRTPFSPASLPWNPSLGDLRLYGAAGAMVLGNLLLPAAVHGVPNAGRVLMPLFLFTLVAGWRFGLRAGLLTALASPLVHSLLTGMPAAQALPGVLGQSALLAALAALASAGFRRLGARGALVPLALGAVVALHQALVLAPRVLAAGLPAGGAALAMRWPGLALWVLGGWALLATLGDPGRADRA